MTEQLLSQQLESPSGTGRVEPPSQISLTAPASNTRDTTRPASPFSLTDLSSRNLVCPHVVVRAAGDTCPIARAKRMIPTLLLIGLTTGAVARLNISIVVGAAFAIAWGLGVGLADESLVTGFGGAALGAANLATGWAFGRALRWALTRARPATH